VNLKAIHGPGWNTTLWPFLVPGYHSKGDKMLNQIQCQDYREFLASVPSVSVQAVITDPPYGMGYQNNYTSRKHEILKGDDTKFSYGSLIQLCFALPGGVSTQSILSKSSPLVSR
jgi:hypothetical protein